jgi:hypothetical protein
MLYQYPTPPGEKCGLAFFSCQQVTSCGKNHKKAIAYRQVDY